MTEKNPDIVILVEYWWLSIFAMSHSNSSMFLYDFCFCSTTSILTAFLTVSFNFRGTVQTYPLIFRGFACGTLYR